MKKILLLLFIVTSISVAKASDTLTVRQVYNFNVGDTFDYENVIRNYDLEIYTTTFTRMIISQKTVSVNQDTIIYNTNWVITNLDSTAVYQLDTFYRDPLLWSTGCTFFDTTTFIFEGKFSNDIESIPLTTTESGYSYTVTAGWGETDRYKSEISNNGVDYNSDLTELVYYSNGTQTFGTPYYTLEGVNNISNTLNIDLSPNPTTGTLHLSLSDVGQNYQFILTDLLGKEILSKPISQTETTLDVSNFASGIYLWRLVGKNGTIKTEKVVKE
jgi:hypothetical protein